jgi:hypothetical protein
MAPVTLHDFSADAGRRKQITCDGTAGPNLTSLVDGKGRYPLGNDSKTPITLPKGTQVARFHPISGKVPEKDRIDKALAHHQTAAAMNAVLPEVLRGVHPAAWDAVVEAVEVAADLVRGAGTAELSE